MYALAGGSTVNDCTPFGYERLWTIHSVLSNREIMCLVEWVEGSHTSAPPTYWVTENTPIVVPGNELSNIPKKAPNTVNFPIEAPGA